MSATEHEVALVQANVTLLAKLAWAERKLAIADQLAAMLRTAAPDWREAMATIARWEAQR